MRYIPYINGEIIKDYEQRLDKADKENIKLTIIVENLIVLSIILICTVIVLSL